MNTQRGVERTMLGDCIKNKIQIIRRRTGVTDITETAS